MNVTRGKDGYLLLQPDTALPKNFVESGFTLSAGTGLQVLIAAGRCDIGGKMHYTESTMTLDVPANSVTAIYLNPSVLSDYPTVSTGSGGLYIGSAVSGISSVTSFDVEGVNNFLLASGVDLSNIFLKDGPTASYRNKVINGNFDIWQRGNTFSAAGFTADRWCLGLTSGTCTVSKNGPTGTTGANPLDKSYALITGTAASGYLSQSIENVNALAGKTVTLSFYMNPISGANTGAQPYLRQYFGMGGSPSASVDTKATTIFSYPTTGGLQRCILTFNLPGTSGKTFGTNNNDYLMLVLPLSGTFSMSLLGVQLEEGPTATAFEQRPIGIELALCQRFFEVLEVNVASSSTGVSNVSRASWFFKVTKRTTPTLIQASGSSTYSVYITKDAVHLESSVGASPNILAAGSNVSAEL